jgi:tRNA (adenine22-N1)-methyltransferase
MEINFGPVLMQNKNKIFYKKWSNQLLFQQKLLHNLKKAKVIDDLKVKQVTKLIMMIEEMIKDDES